jgi:DNA repair exonuclease SbcCD ATPase subunit
MIDCYIIDNELGRTALGVLEAGGEAGLSTSGFGDFEADGITVSPESYSLERWSDFVLEPSYSVFGSIDDKISEASMADTEKQEGGGIANFHGKKAPPFGKADGGKKAKEEDDDEDKDDPEEEKAKKESRAGTGMKLSLREKRELEASLKKIYEDVKGIKAVRERLERSKEALTFYEDADVESYKGEFEELVKEAEKEFEATLAKGEQVDAVKKESEETSQMAKEAKKEAEDLKKENEILKKENEELKAKAKESKKLKDDSSDLLSSMVESMRRSIPYEKYEELRQYAIRATKLYSEMKSDRNLLQIKVQEMAAAGNALEEARMVQFQKDAAARSHIEKVRERNAKVKTLSEQKLREAKETEFMRNVKPEVLEYYNDLIRMGENVSSIRGQILSRRTLIEAQMLVLKARHKKPTQMDEATPNVRDLSAPLPVKNYRQVMPDTPMAIPKGYI